MTSTQTAGARPGRSLFYVGMAILFALIGFLGFTPTYWSKLATGSFGGNPILHVHGVLFFGWTVLYIIQTGLVASGRTVNHRALGLLGISWFTAMAIAVVLANINAIKVAQAMGVGDAAARFSAVSLLSLGLMICIFVLAIANVNRPEMHKRFMILFMIPMMQAALARVFMVIMPPPPGAFGPPPIFVSLPPGVVACLLLLIPIIHDWRTRGRPHPVYLIGLPVLALQIISTVPIGNSAGWIAFANGLAGLAR